MIRGVPGADLEELVEMIATSGGAEVVRPTKARRMFASRACRKSVMIGKALNHKQMTTVRNELARRSFLRSSALELCRKTDPACNLWRR
jgi:DNA mismatch repair ATPase MutL